MPPACRRAPASPCCAAPVPGPWLAGRDYLLPEDVQAVLPGVVGHRLHGGDGENEDPARLLQPLLELAIP